MAGNPGKSIEFVVGQKDEDFCWLLAANGDERTDDQNIELAQRFTSLKEAQKAAEPHSASVFEIIDETIWPATLEEVC